jgi:lysophospholipid acyltransferase (LPLAT)-like uncharacterized protein
MSLWKSFLVILSSFLLRALCNTIRFRFEDESGMKDAIDRPVYIVAFWHNRLLLIPYLYEQFCKGYTSVAFISSSRDGQLISRVVGRFGIQTAEGSTSKNGARAALQVIHSAQNRDRLDIAITPDGPRGPRYQLQPGVLQLAQLTGRPIVALTFHLEYKWELNSWDKFQIPMPFTRCLVVLRKPVEVPRKATKEELEALRQQLTDLLGT